ncbi:hypothetical protein GNP93_23435 [Paenibacillus validus]|uniref:Uncharacterized protein n=1 Tax=Paenibacillus validus TaxID=44253 RepID=A0A7X2ZET6_9BACL|nr:hypothetical protein [Paenibacillus validus]
MGTSDVTLYAKWTARIKRVGCPSALQSIKLG